MQPVRPFEVQLVVLSESGLPPHKIWTTELRAAGLDIEVHPARHDYGDCDCLVPVSVCGHLAPVKFDAACKEHRDWFPNEIRKQHSPEALQLNFLTREDSSYDSAWEKAAHWAVAGSLLRLRSAVLFDCVGLRRESPECFYERARALMAELTPLPHPDPDDPHLDLRSQWARQYDEFRLNELSFSGAEPNPLLEQMLKEHDEACRASDEAERSGR